jgi:hypothetical protein
MDKELTNDICDLIAARAPYSFDEVRRQYDRLKSFDLLIAAIDFAAVHGIELGRITTAILVMDETLIEGDAKEKPVGVLRSLAR